MAKAPKKKTDAQLRAEGVIIAEAVGKADNGGKELANRIEAAQQGAIEDAHRMGIADDCPGERLAEILGDAQWADKIGADFIREQKILARKRAKELFRLEQEEQRAAEQAARDAADA